MSEMRWKDLRDADFDALKSLAEQFGAYIDAAVEQTEMITEDVVKKHLSADNYESQTADDIRDQANMLADSFQDDLHEYASVKIKATLEDAHTELTAAQTEMVDLLDTMAGKYKVTGKADDHGLTISDELAARIENLNPPAELIERAGLSESQLAAATSRAYAAGELVDAAEAEAEEFTGVLRAIMTRAHNAEATATSILESVIDDPAEQPPPLGATYDDLIDDYKTENAERNAAFLQELASGDSEATPHGVNEWWNSLSDEERAALVEDHPDLVGGLDGIPSDTRDDVNRDLLEDELTSTNARIEEIQERMDEMFADGSHASSDGAIELLALQNELSELQERSDNAQSLQAALDDRGDNLYLLGFDTSKDGQTAVSVGNPDTAAHTAVYVPGTTSDLEGVGGLIHDAEVMQGDAARVSSDGQTAVVMWLEYDAPDNAVPFAQDGPIPPEAWSTDQALDARSDLDSFLDGLSATHNGEPHTTLMGHSYGSATIGATSAEYEIAADQVIDFASPGLTVDSAAELGVGADNVWSTRADGDVIDYALATGAMGADPIASDFGGNTFAADSIGDSGTDIHSGYLKSDGNEPNQARTTMAEIITGQKN